MALKSARFFRIKAAAFAAIIALAGGAAKAGAQGILLRTIDDPLPGVQNNFGRNIMVTADGMIMAGGQSDVGGVPNAGNAYLINAETGAIVHTMPNPEPESDVGYSAFSWVGDTRLVVTAFFKDDGQHEESGRAYVFDKQTGQLTRTILNPTPGAIEQFGYGVGMLGDVAILGARGDDTAGTDSGTVYLFDTHTGNLLRTIINPHPTGQDNFGYSVAGVGSDRVLVGAPGSKVNGLAFAGAAYLLNANTGAVVHKFENPFPIQDGFFGFQVRAHGDDVLIGAPNNNKAFLYDGETGALIHQFSNPNQKPGDVYGSSVASVGNNIMVGNPQPYEAFNQPGVAYLYSGETGSLLQKYHNPTPRGQDRFGISAAGWNGNIIVSADQNWVNNIPSVGSIYVFQAPPTAACCEWNLYE